MNKIIISILFLSILCNAEVPAVNGAAPAPNYGAMMPAETEQGENKAFIGNDDLKQDKIEYGLGYKKDMGISYIKKMQNADGSIYFIDTRTNEKINISEKQTSELYNSSYKDGLVSSTSSTELTSEKKAQQKKAREERKAELNKSEYSPQKTENYFHSGLEPAARGNSIVNQVYLSSTEQDTEEVKNSSKFYEAAYSTAQDKNNIKTMKNNSNAAKLASAYETLDKFKADLNAKRSSKNVQCYISRELVPKYFCPLIGKENTLYGGDRKTTTSDAVKECGKQCKEAHSCIPYNVVPDLNVNLGTVKNMNLYPNWNSTDNFIKTGDIDDSMLIDFITYDIKIKPSAEWTGTAEEFETFLEINKPKFRFSLVKGQTTLGNPQELIIDKEVVSINSSLINKKTNVSTLTQFFTFIFYKPFITDNLAIADLVDKDKWKMIGSIDIENIKATYKSKDVYFCPFRQLVNLASECNGEGGQMITLTNGGQIYNICTDSSHKIGPDRKTGAFYSDEDCKASCIEGKDCLPTYKHYTSFNSTDIFKAKVGCVDNEDNTGCTEEKCINLINELEKRPMNEWVTYNDHDKKQTINDFVINPNVVRPKFDLGSELSTAPAFNEMFQSEMKDSAYKYMLNKGTFNRITYRIGEPSPRKISYKKEFLNGESESISLNMKPKSNDIDNNKTYNIYIVLEVDELYKPVAGVFMLDGQAISANGNPELQFRDKTYLIKTNSSTDNWKVFRKKQFTNVKKIYDIKRCEDGTYEEKPYKYFSNHSIPSTCSVSMKIIWPETPQLTIDRYGYYNSADDTFLILDENAQKAEKFVSQKFSSDVVINNYSITMDSTKEIYRTPGAIIKSQKPLQNDLSFEKDYNVPIEEIKAGWIYDYKFYVIYSDKELTYKEVTNALDDEKNAFYSKSNPNVYPTKINHDGEINNHIKPFILGDSNISTVNLETSPFTQEEGQKVFKFMFLYDDENGTKPFAGYQIKGK